VPFFGFFVVPFDEPLAGAFAPLDFAGVFDLAAEAFFGAGFFSTFGGSGGGGGGATYGSSSLALWRPGGARSTTW
jgi:hypothetical protein